MTLTVLLCSRLLDSGSIHLVNDSGLVGSTSLGGVPQEQKMLKGNLPRGMYHQVY